MILTFFTMLIVQLSKPYMFWSEVSSQAQRYIALDTLVGMLSPCETMCSTTTIYNDKISTLTLNMVGVFHPLAI
ncbi:hypothetical protein QVD17_03537 [Tagetes erecta]|uniref:Secreted protein n=1 Tax=Tagetes erecta TaxID=13708 RepID=A0AAD8LBH1_TARER|nr:hypothetical protein QVD17_03537 [Tagetes erecta]